MTNFLEIALQCASRGWHVFPLKPRGKSPLISKDDGGNGLYDATTDPEQIRAWWTKCPQSNVGVACGASNLCVWDCDHGLTGPEDLQAWRQRNGIPITYTVRTGKRDGYGVHMYFTNALPPGQNKKWELDGCKGEIRSAGALVVAAGSIHPDTGEIYEVLIDQAPTFRPGAVEKSIVQAAQNSKPVLDGGPITENRNMTMISLLGAKREAGRDNEELRAYAIHVNDTRVVPPLDEDELERIISNACRFPMPEPVPEVVIGSEPTEKPVADWRTHYHTFVEMENAPPTSFLIDGFLPMDAITALAAPVGQRKSLIALNVAHALCTKEPLFDYFTVRTQPTRVLYLCPEMGLRSFTDRLRKIGLMPHVGQTLFCRTMSAEGTLDLKELTVEELTGAVVIIDTAVRYLKGDENSSEHMRQFAEGVFRLMRDGAVSVLLLHHSAKGTKESSELSLENAMRGSGELGAFVSSCWATRLQDPAEPYQSASYITNVKQRDFESRPFEVTSGSDCRLHIVDKPGDHVKLSSKSAGAPADADGNEEAALRVIRDNPTLSQRALVLKLKEQGIKRSKSWVGEKRYELLQVNGGRLSG